MHSVLSNQLPCPPAKVLSSNSSSASSETGTGGGADCTHEAKPKHVCRGGRSLKRSWDVTFVVRGLFSNRFGPVRSTEHSCHTRTRSTYTYALMRARGYTHCAHPRHKLHARARAHTLPTFHLTLVPHVPPRRTKNEVPDHYQCPVCLKPFHHPVIVNGCGHEFCEGCLR